ncbi:MAG: TIGR01777 family oxidoreductase [Verrucomicrobiales bacterium]
MEKGGKTLGIVGASGFIGSALARQAVANGWRVVGFSRQERSPSRSVTEWRVWGERPEVEGIHVLVNLAGESIAQRWTQERKKVFRASRVGVTSRLVEAIKAAERPPEVLINGSAVGIYGDRGDEVLTESSVRGEGYLADLCEDWEQAAVALEGGACRVVRLRTGVVLGAGGDAWGRMKRVFSLGAGGRLGKGDQWMPWIHIDDLVSAILFLAANELSGPVHGTAPEPVKNEDFTRHLASSLGRPAFFHAPEWVLKRVLGDFSTALLASQRALPEALLREGFCFRFPTLEEALEDLS